MKTSEFNASLRFCENEAELRNNHADQLLDALLLAAQRASEGEIPLAYLITYIKNARYAWRNTSRLTLREQEAEVTAHGEPDLRWIS